MKKELSPGLIASIALVAVGLLALIAWRMFNPASASTTDIGAQVKAMAAMKSQVQQTGQNLPPPGTSGLPTGLPGNPASQAHAPQ